jgi:hypothetical protein
MKIFITITLLLVTFNIYGNNNLYSGLQYERVGRAISRLETGNYKSKLCRKYNNLFGMKVGSRKFHYGKTTSNYAKYKNKMLSIADYAAYEKRLIRKYHITTQKQYIAVISRKYAKNPNYKKLLQKQLKNSC